MTANIKQFLLQTTLLNEEELKDIEKKVEFSAAFNNFTNNYGSNRKNANYAFWYKSCDKKFFTFCWY